MTGVVSESCNHKHHPRIGFFTRRSVIGRYFPHDRNDSSGQGTHKNGVEGTSHLERGWGTSTRRAERVVVSYVNSKTGQEGRSVLQYEDNESLDATKTDSLFHISPQPPNISQSHLKEPIHLTAFCFAKKWKRAKQRNGMPRIYLITQEKRPKSIALPPTNLTTGNMFDLIHSGSSKNPVEHKIYPKNPSTSIPKFQDLNTANLETHSSIPLVKEMLCFPCVNQTDSGKNDERVYRTTSDSYLSACSSFAASARSSCPTSENDNEHAITYCQSKQFSDDCNTFNCANDKTYSSISVESSPHTRASQQVIFNGQEEVTEDIKNKHDGIAGIAGIAETRPTVLKQVSFPAVADDSEIERRELFEEISCEEALSTPLSTPQSTPKSTPLSAPLSTPQSTPKSTPLSTPQYVEFCDHNGCDNGNCEFKVNESKTPVKLTQEEVKRKYHPIVRRKCLSAKRNVQSKTASIWGVLRHFIGRDLTTVSMPIILNEPLSLLQRIVEDFDSAHLLYHASLQSSPSSRLLWVAAFACTSYSGAVGRYTKPFNPLQGETFEMCHHEDFRYLAEQVSHHPPVSAYYCESTKGPSPTLAQTLTSQLTTNDTEVFDDKYSPAANSSGESPARAFRAWGHCATHASFGGNSVTITLGGDVHVALNVGGVSEHYTWKRPKTVVHNIIFGSMWMEVVGEIKVTCGDSGHSAVLNFIPKSSSKSVTTQRHHHHRHGSRIGHHTKKLRSVKFERLHSRMSSASFIDTELDYILHPNICHLIPENIIDTPICKKSSQSIKINRTDSHSYGSRSHSHRHGKDEQSSQKSALQDKLLHMDASSLHRICGSIRNKNDEVVFELGGIWSKLIWVYPYTPYSPAASFVNVNPSSSCSSFVSITNPHVMPPFQKSVIWLSEAALKFITDTDSLDDSSQYYGMGPTAITLNEISVDYDPTVINMPSTDSRFRPDQRLYEEGHVDAAQAMKLKVEQHQRDRNKIRESNGEVYHPRWFKQKTSEIGDLTWEFGNEYWKHREFNISFADNTSDNIFLGGEEGHPILPK